MCYAGTLVNGFVWDDRDLILDDPRTHTLWRAASFFVRPFGGTGESSRNAAYYRPVVKMSFALEYALFGARPWAYHLTNIVLHVAASCGVLAMAAVLGGRGAAGVVAGLAFALHPLHSESVSWISGRTDLLACALMVLCTARLYSAQAKGNEFSYLALGAFALAAFSKEVAVAYPLFLIGADWLVGGRRPFGRWVRERLLGVHLWFLIVLGLFLLMRAVALDGARAADADVPNIGARLLTACKLVAAYVWVLAVPKGLSVENTLAPGAWTDVGTLAGFGMVAVLALLILRVVRSGRQCNWDQSLCLSSLWFILMLVPVLNLIPIFDLFAERFAYVPSVAACWAGAVVFQRMIRGRARWLLAGVLACYAALAIDRTQDWQAERRLFYEAAKSAPGSSRARLSLGATYARRGRPRLASREYVRSGKLEARASGPHNALGDLYMQARRFDDAVGEFESALALNRASHVYLVNLGRAYRAKGELDKAFEHLSAALAMAPEYADAHFELGNVCYLRSDMSGASEAFRAALSCDPHYAEAHHNLALCYLGQNRLKDALGCLQRAISAKHDYPAAHRNLGYTYYRLGRHSSAIDAYRNAVHMNPYDLNTLLDLAMLVREHGDPAEAVALYERALRLDRGNERAIRGNALASKMLKARRGE